MLTLWFSSNAIYYICYLCNFIMFETLRHKKFIHVFSGILNIMQFRRVIRFLLKFSPFEFCTLLFRRGPPVNPATKNGLGSSKLETYNKVIASRTLIKLHWTTLSSIFTRTYFLRTPHAPRLHNRKYNIRYDSAKRWFIFKIYSYARQAIYSSSFALQDTHIPLLFSICSPKTYNWSRNSEIDLSHQALTPNGIWNDDCAYNECCYTIIILIVIIMLYTCHT